MVTVPAQPTIAFELMAMNRLHTREGTPAQALAGPMAGGFWIWPQRLGRINTMTADPKDLLFTLHDRGRVVSIAKMGETLYELDGRLYRTFLVPEKDRQPGEGPWRAEEVTQGGSIE